MTDSLTPLTLPCLYWLSFEVTILSTGHIVLASGVKGSGKANEEFAVGRIIYAAEFNRRFLLLYYTQGAAVAITFVPADGVVRVGNNKSG